MQSETFYKKGDLIGQEFQVIDILGKGEFGVVYLVYSSVNKSVYALKTFRDKYLQNASIKEHFKKEANIWINLERHPYLVRAYFVTEIAGRLFIAMEYIAKNREGLNSLDDYLKRSPPNTPQILRWAIQFCHGIEYAYSKGLQCHRDIKPSNILISHDKTVKISDFGLGDLYLASDQPIKEITIHRNEPRTGTKNIQGNVPG